MGFIYKITNTLNGKAYIGQTTRKYAEQRISEHLDGKSRGAIAHAIKKHGRDNFIYEILHHNVESECLNDLEVEEINKHNTLSPHGYNIMRGGLGGREQPPEIREKISKSMKGKKKSPEHIRKVAEANKGVKRSSEYRQKMSKARKGIPSHMKGKKHTLESRRKMSEAKKGRKLSLEHRQNMSKGHKKRTGLSDAQKRAIASRVGVKRPPEIIEKIRIGNQSIEYKQAFQIYQTFPVDMELKNKHKILCDKFPNTHVSTIYKWLRKWEKH